MAAQEMHMASKRPSLADNMRAVQGDRPTVRLIPEPEHPAAEPKESKQNGIYRDGKKRATAALSVEDHRRLKMLAASSGDTIEELMTEAVTDLLAKRGA
jgi:hypothetical protein